MGGKRRFPRHLGGLRFVDLESAYKGYTDPGETTPLSRHVTYRRLVFIIFTRFPLVESVNMEPGEWILAKNLESGI